MPHLCNFISFLRGQDCQTDVSYNRKRVHMSTPYPILHMRTEERNNCPYKKTHQAFCNRDHQQSAVEKCQAKSSRESLTVDAEKWGYPLLRSKCNGSCGVRTMDLSLNVREVRLGSNPLSFLATVHF